MAIDANPEKMEAFALQLSGFGQQVGTTLATIKSGVSRLGGTWRDRQYQEFVQGFQKATASLQRLTEQADKTSHKLRQDAELVRRARDQR